MSLQFRKADISDIKILVKTRIQVLRAVNGLNDFADMSGVEQQSYQYYQQALAKNDHAAYLAFDRDQVVGTGGISFYKVMPTYHNASGEKAYIMNMFTYPDYRRKGIAFKILGLLVGEAKSRGVDFIALEATDLGRPLYVKFGFVPMMNEMQLL